MTTKLRLYNEALLALGMRKLSGLTEAVEPRRVLDDAYTGFVDLVLSEGNWKFALRSVHLDYDTDITPTFGYARAFTKPTDYVRFSIIATDEFFTTPLLNMEEDGDYFYAGEDELYLKYVSNDASYGADLSEWPESVAEFGALLLASKVRRRIAPDVDKNELERDLQKSLSKAQTKDALSIPTTFMKQGTWASSRGGRSRNYRLKTGGFILG